jgi:hypothetical protein
MSIILLAAPFLLTLDRRPPPPPPPTSVTSSDGQTWTATVNVHGAILRSGRTVIYLGHSCEAQSPTLGRGTWDYANGGFRVLVGRRNFGFPRQAIDGLTQGQRCLGR